MREQSLMSGTGITRRRGVTPPWKNRKTNSVQEAAREVPSKEVVPYRAEWDRRESVIPLIIAARRAGFFGP